jgi:hypothetical protein
MAKRPLTKDPAGTSKTTRARKLKAATTVSPTTDMATDTPSAIASETPAPDRILSGSPDFSTVRALTSADGIGPSDDEIREAAYHRWLARGAHPGDELDDWFEAERTLRRR